MKNPIETAHEITKLIKFSPDRQEIFRAVSRSDHHDPSLRVLCVCADSLESIVANRTHLQESWEEAKAVSHATDTKARIVGVEARMKRVYLLIWCSTW